VSLALDLTLDGARYGPGDWVRGRVAVTEGGRSRALKVALHFRERTADYAAVARSEAIEPLHYGELASGQSFDFAIQLPPDALPNYSSANGALYWEVELKSDEPGFDTVLERQIEVVVPHQQTA
jgi:hypothetical protein